MNGQQATDTNSSQITLNNRGIFAAAQKAHWPTNDLSACTRSQSGVYIGFIYSIEPKKHLACLVAGRCLMGAGSAEIYLNSTPIIPLKGFRASKITTARGGGFIFRT